MRTTLPSLAFALAGSLAAACSGGSGDTVTPTLTDSAGVQIVTTPQTDDVPLAFSAERLFTLGGSDDPEQSFYRISRGFVAADAGGRIYVLDGSQYHVQVFDSTGRHLSTLGRQGSGPGEMSFPSALTVSPRGEVWVADLGSGSFVHWGPDGELLESTSLPEFYIGLGARWTGEGLVAQTDNLERHALVLTPDRLVVKLAPANMKAVRYESCGMGLSGAEPLFAPALTWTTTAASVVAARTTEYAIDFFADGVLRRSVRRDVERRPATTELAEASLDGGVTFRTPRGEAHCAADDIVRARGFASDLPQLNGIAVDPDGELWVQRYEVGADTPRPIDVFDAGGAYVGTLPLGTPFPVGFAPGGRVLVSERDALDVERLVVLRVTLG